MNVRFECSASTRIRSSSHTVTSILPPIVSTWSTSAPSTANVVSVCCTIVKAIRAPMIIPFMLPILYS